MKQISLVLLCKWNIIFVLKSKIGILTLFNVMRLNFLIKGNKNLYINKQKEKLTEQQTAWKQ